MALAVAAAGRVAEALAATWLMEQHREIASTLQAALLPPRLPEIDGISLAVRYWPAGAVTIVGGDFYDVFPLGDERWAIVIGDVCGSGPNAAAVTAIARHTIRAAAMHGAAGADALEWTNLALHAGNRDLFCTAVFSTVERTADGMALHVDCGRTPAPPPGARGRRGEHGRRARLAAGGPAGAGARHRRRSSSTPATP